MPRRRDDVEDDYDPDNYNDALLVRANSAREFAVFTGKPDRKAVAMARRVATVWADYWSGPSCSLGRSRGCPFPIRSRCSTNLL
jgi:hypothetical protein